MDRELVKRWIDALRSGEYRQGMGTLRKGNEYCCLGILAELIHGKDCWYKRGAQEDGWTSAIYCYIPVGGLAEILDFGEMLDVMDAELVGLSSLYSDLTQERLSHMNDSGCSFEKIADYLEAHLLNDEKSYGANNDG
jgi:hypothetical protein